MADAGEILIVIPARGGSKRLPRKNILPLAGKHLICWTIEAALEAKLNARIMVTSDDEKILSIARQYFGKEVIVHKRPDELATDTSATTDVLIEAVQSEISKGYSPQTIILLQPTSPLRNSEDISRALDVYSARYFQETVVTVCKVDHPSAWIGHMDLESSGRITGLDLTGMRSQDYSKEYRLNGAVYVAPVTNLIEQGSLFTENISVSVMPRERSFDIDEMIDFHICESIINVKSRLIFSSESELYR
jgi:N-acylneuraminate cytidylyltransferase/CMP-N,N'-diacetyllegionaminic acid synthase